MNMTKCGRQSLMPRPTCGLVDARRNTCHRRTGSPLHGAHRQPGDQQQVPEIHPRCAVLLPWVWQADERVAEVKPHEMIFCGRSRHLRMSEGSLPKAMRLVW